MMLQIAILASLVIIPGFLLVVNLYRPNSYSSFLLACSLSFGAGAGIFSILFFLWSLLFYPGYSLVSFILFVAVIAIILLAFIIKKMPHDLFRVFPFISHVSWTTICLLILFLVSFIFSISALGKIFYNFPNGEWDATAIWNLRARFIFFGKQEWYVAFSPELESGHQDYPLLLPSLIAGSWVVLGQYIRRVPIIIASLFYLSLVMVFISALWKSKGINLAFLGAIAFLTIPDFISQSASQLADVPLAFFFLASCVLIYICEVEDGQQILPYLIGFFAGLAAWTKNEGLSFVVALLLMKFLLIIFATRLSLSRERQIRQFMKIILGLLLPILVTLIFKGYFPYKSDIVGSLDISAIIMKLSDANRYKMIFDALLLQFVDFGGLKFPLGIFPLMFIYGLIMGKTKSLHRTSIATIQVKIVLATMFIQFFIAYLITPHPLDWHIENSMDRLIMQLFPSLLFLLFVIFNDPFDPSPVPDPNIATGSVIGGQVNL